MIDELVKNQRMPVIKKTVSISRSSLRLHQGKLELFLEV